MTDTITTDALNLSPFTVDALARFALREASLTGNARAYATPYLQALTCCEYMSDTYGAESAGDIARYALSNLTSWRGPIAKAWKAEVNARLRCTYCHEAWMARRIDGLDYVCAVHS